MRKLIVSLAVWTLWATAAQAQTATYVNNAELLNSATSKAPVAVPIAPATAQNGLAANINNDEADLALAVAHMQLLEADIARIKKDIEVLKQSR